MAKVVVDDFGGAPFADHNMPCAVCWEESAVLNLSVGIFEPCWRCQDIGWSLTHKRKKLWKRG